MEPGVLLLATGNPSRARRSCERMCERAGVVGLEHWHPFDVGVPGFSVSVALPIGSLDIADDIAGLLGEVCVSNRKTHVYIDLVSVPVGKGWKEGGYVYRPGGIGDKHSASALRKRVERERKAPYLALASASEADGSAHKRHPLLRDVEPKPIGRVATMAQYIESAMRQAKGQLERDADESKRALGKVRQLPYSEAGAIADAKRADAREAKRVE